MKNRGTGAGGANTNVSGLSFEEQFNINNMVIAEGYHLKEIGASKGRSGFSEVWEGNKLVGYCGRQHKLYAALSLVDSSINKEYVKSIFSKKMNPDGFIITLHPKQLIILELKNQNKEGSVDEKIQSGPFKLSMFEKLLGPKGFSCSYQYILSEWYQKPKYRNLKEYYFGNTKINIWVQGENIQELKLKDFIK